MAVCLSRKVADSQRRIFPQAPGDRTDPARRFMLRPPARPFEEPLDRITQVTLGYFCLASVDKVSRLSSDVTSDPFHDGYTWQQSASNPERIELDLDLFESNGRGRVAMARAGAIENRGGSGNELLSDFRLIDIGADHKE